MLPHVASFSALGFFSPGAMYFFAFSYTEKRVKEYVIWRSRVPDIPSHKPLTPSREA